MTNTDLFQNTSEEIKPGLKKLGGLATILLVVGVLASAGGFLLEGQDKFFQSYLTSYLFWFGLTSGCIALLMLHHTVGGGWGFVIRRMLEAGSRCLPLVVLAFIPIVLGMHSLYSWTHPEAAQDAILRIKAPYLNVPFFIGRAVFYFAVWGVFTFLMNKWGAAYDTPEGGEKVFGKLNRLGAFGLLMQVLLVTFMAVDWVMSITPHWVSSMFGPLFVVGQALTTLALMNLFVGTLGVRTSLVKLIPERYFRDLGNLMMALVLVWSYMSFSQYLIQYSGNIKEEVEWFVIRRHGGWGIIGLSLIFLQFALPFAVLLSSSMKTNPRNLWKIAAFILVMRWIDLLYLSRPNLDPNLPSALHLSDVGTWCLMGGAWLLMWIREVQRRPLVPQYDPRFAYQWALLTEHHDHAPEGYEDDPASTATLSGQHVEVNG
jgi:hypothetical protein